MGSASGQTATLVLAAVLVGFVLTRLPSGNVWDAVLDPWALPPFAGVRAALWGCGVGYDAFLSVTAAIRA